MSSLSLLLLLLVMGAATVRQGAAPPPVPTAYEVLESYNLPRGILPEGVVGYDLDPATGKFTAYLNRSCRYSVDGHEFMDEATMSGTLSRDKITDMHGLNIKVRYFWKCPFITRSGGNIKILAFIFPINFSVDTFNVSPHCG